MNTTLIQLDLRELEPPQPLMKILETISTLPEGGVLAARTRWRPVLLYAPLAARGFVGESKEQDDGSYLTLIRRH